MKSFVIFVSLVLSMDSSSLASVPAAVVTTNTSNSNVKSSTNIMGINPFVAKVPGNNKGAMSSLIKAEAAPPTEEEGVEEKEKIAVPKIIAVQDNEQRDNRELQTKVTQFPSSYPSLHPSIFPSNFPSNSPSAFPISNEPTSSSFPSCSPTTEPTGTPSEIPSTSPSRQPTRRPSQNPSSNPTVSLKPTTKKGRDSQATKDPKMPKVNDTRAPIKVGKAGKAGKTGKTPKRKCGRALKDNANVFVADGRPDYPNTEDRSGTFANFFDMDGEQTLLACMVVMGICMVVVLTIIRKM